MSCLLELLEPTELDDPEDTHFVRRTTGAAFVAEGLKDLRSLARDMARLRQALTKDT